jgi:Heparinase II/III-like protein.
MTKEEKRKLNDAKRVLKNTFVFDNPWDMEGTVEPVTFSNEIDWNLIPGDDEEWLFMLSRFGFLANLAAAFLLEEKEEYREKGNELILDFIRRNPHSKEKDTLSYRSLDEAIRIHNWISFISLTSSKLAADEEVINGIGEAALRLFLNRRPFLELSNWGTIGYAYLTEAWLWLNEREKAKASEALLVSNLVFSVLPDGVQFEESPMYHAQVLIAILDLLRSARSRQFPLSNIIREKAHDMAYAALKSAKPDGRQFMQSDSDDTPLSDVFSLSALILDDGVLKGAGLKELSVPYTKAEISRYEKLKALPSPFHSAKLESSGNYYLRSGALVTHFRCGAMGSGHGHSDLLHIDVSKGKDDILTDSGRYTYTECETRYLLKSDRMHNTVLVDDRDSAVSSDSWGYEKRPSFIKGGLEEFEDGVYAWGTSLGYSPVVIRRELVQIKDKVLFILDTITGDNKHTYTRTFHFDNKMRAEIKDDFIAYGKYRLYPDGKERVSLEKTPYSKHYNRLEEKLTVKAKSEGASTVLSAVLLLSPELRLEQEEVLVTSSGKPAEGGCAFHVFDEKDDIRLLFTGDCKISGVGFISGFGLKGYGRIIASVNGKYHVISC